MLLGTRRYQVGSDGGSSFEVGIHGCFCYSIADARGTGKFQLAYMDAFAARSRNAVSGDEARPPEGIVANILVLEPSGTCPF